MGRFRLGAGDFAATLFLTGPDRSRGSASSGNSELWQDPLHEHQVCGKEYEHDEPAWHGAPLGMIMHVYRATCSDFRGGSKCRKLPITEEMPQGTSGFMPSAIPFWVGSPLHSLLKNATQRILWVERAFSGA